jgi:hypothetical protein
LVEAILANIIDTHVLTMLLDYSVGAGPDLLGVLSAQSMRSDTLAMMLHGSTVVLGGLRELLSISGAFVYQELLMARG